MGMTGKKRFRSDKKGRLILQVECTVYDPDPPFKEYAWRDATIEDITNNIKIDGLKLEN